MFIAGGALKGGKVYTQWPGLSKGQLYQGRDLMPTTDMRAVIKGVLVYHLNTTLSQLESTFPNSESIRPLDWSELFNSLG